MPEKKVKIRWDEKGYYRMELLNGDFIQEFFPCKNFRLLFKGISRRDNKYRTFLIKTQSIDAKADQL